ncbi:hypothetical protein JB92DRAFT_2838503 [Gautieria morchelliformis]|nr:hypothetical protein JB92DRAFT_2838503 [Gautieria morchelliformis]
MSYGATGIGLSVRSRSDIMWDKTWLSLAPQCCDDISGLVIFVYMLSGLGIRCRYSNGVYAVCDSVTCKSCKAIRYLYTFRNQVSTLRISGNLWVPLTRLGTGDKEWWTTIGGQQWWIQRMVDSGGGIQDSGQWHIPDNGFNSNPSRDRMTLRTSFRLVCPGRRASWKPHIEATHYTPPRVLMNDILLAEEESRKQPSSYRKGIGQKIAKTVSSSLLTPRTNECTPPSTRSPVSPSLSLAGGGSRKMGIGEPLNEANSVAGIAPIEVIVDSDDCLVARDRLAASHVFGLLSGDGIRTLIESGDGAAMPVFYIIDMRRELFHFPALIGPGTAKGVVSGVAELEHFEQVRQGDDSSGDLDTVLRSSGQQSDCGRLESGTYPHGKPLNIFATRNAMNCCWRFVMLSLRIGNFMRWQAFYMVMQVSPPQIAWSKSIRNY